MKDVLDLARIFERVPEIMGLDLNRKARTRWEGGYYLNGQRHPYRRDKMKITPYQGMIWVHEEGNCSQSLPAWLVNVGRAVDFKDAYSILKGEQKPIQHHIEHIFHERKTLYVPESALQAIKCFPLESCPLFRWMCTLFPEERVRKVWDMYNVTTDSNGNAVYWYVDADGRIAYDKRLKYLYNGHRDKSFGGTREYRTKDGYRARPYFGAHLAEGAGMVNIVEAEKTCLLCALEYGGIWLAVGGKNNLKDVAPNARLYPDKDAYSEWGKLGTCVDWSANWKECGEHSDIGDYIVWKHKEG